MTGVYGHDRAGAPVELGARYVVGADGLRSRVARSVGAAINEAGPAGGATQYAYYAGIPWTGIEFFVAERSFAGVFPTHDGEACIWVCTPAADARAVRRRTGSRVEAFGELLERSAPQLAERLRQARRTSPVQGMLRQPNQVRQAFGPGWALVGDAGYHRDAVTAHGISDAFRDAELLAVALDQALRGGAEETTALAALPAAARPGAAGDLRAHLPPGRLSAGADVRRAAEAAERRHRHRGGGAGRPAGPGRAPAGDRLTDTADRKEAIAQTDQPHTAIASQPTPRRRTKMTTTDMTAAEANDSMRNGVDTATLFATLDAVKQAPEAAKFQFRAHNEWLSGTHNRSTIDDFFGVGEERSHERTFVFDADHPAVLVGRDNGPTPVEFVLHALAACLTAGLANIAAARRVRLTEVRSTVTGDIDLNGILGLNPDVRNGYQKITVRFTVKGDAPAEKLRELVEQSRARSAVFDVITNGVPVTIEVDTP